MSYGSLAFIIPLGCMSRCGQLFLPETFHDYRNKQINEHAGTITTIAERIFEAENVTSSRYHKMIQKLLNTLPNHCPKDIKSLLSERLAVIDEEPDPRMMAPMLQCFSITQKVHCMSSLGKIVYTTGGVHLDEKHKNMPEKYFIVLIREGLKDFNEDCLSWVATREISHILETTQEMNRLAQIIASLITASTTFLWNCQPIVSIAATAAAASVTHLIMHYKGEVDADTFSITHCSDEELTAGISFLQKVKESKGRIARFFSSILHPSEDSTIAKIQAALKIPGRVKRTNANVGYDFL